ncbi:MAG: glucose-6-phosphate isomerase [Lentisphaeria bacterium]|nr:glucose-6-phosphate isomerase [Lentisphaeria bacterium]
MNSFAGFKNEYCGFEISFRQAGLEKYNLDELSDKLVSAHQEMIKIEEGAIKNPDEGRQVTHFTDRKEYVDSELFNDVEAFFASVHKGETLAPNGKPFDAIVINGIGGSALGPQLLQFSVNGPYWNEKSSQAREGKLKIYFTDNTDSAGLTDALSVLDLSTTLFASLSKSGGTRETKNNMTAAETAYVNAGLNFANFAIAVTMEGSKLDGFAKEKGFLKVWPMADSIGGRTSETAIVGHVPAAAAGINFRSFLLGACQMDEWTRAPELSLNPSYQLAASWYLLGNGKGDRNMVIVPYADRLVLLSRYFQQLVMESLGKELDLDGNKVYQGISVFGNKGGTDAHAFIQQLNDGRNDFFVTFIEVLKDAQNYDMGDGLTMGDYLHNFQQGLSNALASKQRPVISITMEELSCQALGLIIALYERAVAFYAELIHINAFDQPGVESYKKMSEAVNELTLKVQDFVANNSGVSGNGAELATKLGQAEQGPEVAGILSKIAVNGHSYNGNSVSRKLEGQDWIFSVQ